MIWLIIVLLLLLLLLSGGVYAGIWLYNLVFKRDVNRDAILNFENSWTEQPGNEILERRNKKREIWLKSVRLEHVSIINDEKMTLWGNIYVNTEESVKWAILCHGYMGKGADMTEPARIFSQNGFNVLLPDARGHGESEGKAIGLGWPDRKDLKKWIKFIVKRDPNARIVLYGISMGAVTVMNSLGERLQENVKAAIEDCGYSSLWEELSYQLKRQYKLPAFPFIYMADLVVKLRQGWWIHDADSAAQLKKSDTPILVIHGEKDKSVPFEMSDRLFLASKGPKRRLVVKDAGHGDAYIVGGEGYWKVVFDFINSHINPQIQKEIEQEFIIVEN